VSVEQRILDVANGARFSPTWYDLTELRLIALEARKMDDRIKQLEDRINRAASTFFTDGSDGHVASQMLAILEEERGKVSKDQSQSDSSIWAKAGIGFTTEDKP
jgi:hypothetical protein